MRSYPPATDRPPASIPPSSRPPNRIRRKYHALQLSRWSFYGVCTTAFLACIDSDTNSWWWLGTCFFVVVGGFFFIFGLNDHRI